MIIYFPITLKDIVKDMAGIKELPTGFYYKEEIAEFKEQEEDDGVSE